jgi:hypothetical protein
MGYFNDNCRNFLEGLNKGTETLVKLIGVLRNASRGLGSSDAA